MRGHHLIIRRINGMPLMRKQNNWVVIKRGVLSWDFGNSVLCSGNIFLIRGLKVAYAPLEGVAEAMVFSMCWQPKLTKGFTPGKTHREVTDSDIFLCHFDIRRCWLLLFQYIQQKQPKKIKTEKSLYHILPPSRLFLIAHLKFSWTSSASASACRILRSKACTTTPRLLPLWCHRILGA